MSEKDNGGAAFPSPGVLMDDGRGGEYQQGAYEGMTMRDYFAAKAMQSLILSPEYLTNWPADVAARDAYNFADAMLAERAQ